MGSLRVGLVIYSPRAIRDVQGIAKWIAQDNPSAAMRVVDDIDRVLRLIAPSPMAGEDVGQLMPGLRRTTRGSYVLYYRPADHGIDVVRVVHGARDIGNLFP